MKPEFCLYTDRDRYFIRHADSLEWDFPLLLGGGNPNYVWSTDLNDAKPFQYRRDAMNFMKASKEFAAWTYIIKGVNCRVSYSLRDQFMTVEPSTSGLSRIGLKQLTALLALIDDPIKV